MVYFCTIDVLAYKHVRTRTVSFTLPVDTALFHWCTSRNFWYLWLNRWLHSLSQCVYEQSRCKNRNVMGKVHITCLSDAFAWCLYLLGCSNSLISSDSKGALLWRFYIAGNSRMYLRLEVKCPIGMKFGDPRQVSINVPSIKFQGYLSVGVTLKRVDGRTRN